MLVRLPRITGLDLRLFDFDYDLNFMVFFMGPDEKVYGRYGGRDGKSAEGQLSLEGLRYAMRAALEAHDRRQKEPAPKRAGPSVRAEDYPAAMRLKRNECIHCHQVNEFRREQEKKDGAWTRDTLLRFPLPENIGLTLDVKQGNRVREVKKASATERAGLRAGDELRTLNEMEIASFADVQHALDRAPKEGKITVSWLRGEQKHEGELSLAADWKRSNITWRPSLLDILVSPPFFGDELTDAEKKALDLEPRRLAFRQDKPLNAALMRAGLQPEDVIVGIDGLKLEMDLPQFLAHLRRNYLVGDKITIDVWRKGQRVGLPFVLK